MSQTVPQATLDRVHHAFADRVSNGALPGVVWLVATDDATHVDCIGTVAFDSPTPMQRDTPFRIASLTKPVLAALTLMLIEEGVLGLDDPIERWLPEMANRRVLARVDGPLDETVPAHRSITVEDLLTNRMGFGMLTEPTFDPPFPIVAAASALQLALSQPDPRTPHAPDQWIRRFASLPLMFQPGERWQYNVASLVLGVLVARAAGEPLGDLFARRVFGPLGMRHTGFSVPLELGQRLPAYYMTSFESGRLERHDVSTPEEWSSPPAFPSGAGGLASTVDDFLAFARLLLDRGVHHGQRLLTAGSVDQMTTNQLTPDQIASGGPILSGRGWGYGVGVTIDPEDSWPVPGRYGWAGGYGTVWFNDPHRRLIAMTMTQVSDVLWNGVTAEFEALLGAGS